MAAATWPDGEWWTVGGGGTVWDSIAFDPELDLLYIGVGNGSPWPRALRTPGGGDNLFLCSIDALDPDTGEYLWHYHTTPGESWGYNSNMDIVLADLQIWRESGLARAQSAGDGEADTNSASYRQAEARYVALRKAPSFAALVARMAMERGEPVQIATAN